MPRPLKLLVVEQDRVVAADLDARLRSLGHEVAAAVSTGREALDRLARTPIDLVFVAVALTGEWNAAETSAEIGRRFQAPVIFTAATVDQLALLPDARAAFHHSVIKPFDKRELQLVIESVSRAHATEARFAALEQWFARSITQQADGVIATDTLGRVTFINQPAELLTGWLRHEALGRASDELLRLHHRSSRQRVPDPIARGLAEGLVGETAADLVLARRDGVEIPVWYSAAPVRGGEGRTTGALIVLRDARGGKFSEDERREIEAKLRDAQRFETLGLMAGGMAHDFNNVLTAILGSLALARFGLPAESRALEHLDQIDRASMRAADLCRQMLALSGRTKLTVQPLQVNDVIADTLRLVQLSSRYPSISIQNVAGELPRPVLVDAVQLRQLIVNLVFNAFEAIGNKDGRVTVSTQAVALDRGALDQLLFAEESAPGEFAMIEISDTGPGMPRETLARIFDPFFSTKPNGRGLGLSAVAGIVRNHRGALLVDSQLGRGAIFQVFLPVTAPPAAAPMMPETFQETSASRPMTVPPLLPKTTTPPNYGAVLVADDDDAVRALAQWIVERAGFRAVPARDGDEALAHFRKDPGAFRLVLLDYTMPRMSGDQVLAGLRAVRPTIPVVIITGHGSDFIADMERLGIAGFLQKPFNPDALRDVLKKYLPAGAKA